MYIQTSKIKEQLLMAAALLVCLIACLLILAPTVVSAASKKETYALGCKPNPGPAITDSAGKLSCSASSPNETPYIVDTAGAASNLQHDPTVLVITVDCGTSPLAKNYKKDQSLSSFACKHGTPKVTTLSGNNNPATCDAANNCSDPAANPNANCSTNGCDLVIKYINPLVNLLSVIFGLIAVISIIIGSVQYAASTGDPQKSSAAKDRIRNTIIAIVAYFFLYGFLQFLIPGGLFKAN